MPEQTPTVTVVIAVYNAASTIVETVESLLSQSFEDFEALIVDDGTPDDSIERVSPLLDSRFRVIRQRNRGLNGARNTGIRHARGRYIAFLDADDIWRPQMLATHIAHLDKAPEVGISYSPSELIADDGMTLGLRQSPKLTDITARDVICRNPIGNGSAGVFRREVFDDVAFRREETPPGETWWFDETFRQSTDIECWMRIVARSDWEFRGVPELLVKYRVNTAGLSANTDRQLMYWERALAAMGEIRPDLMARWGRLARAYQLRYLARRAVSSGDGARGWTLVRRAIAEHPAILVQEPAKTFTTLAAALAMRLGAGRPMMLLLGNK